jgi:hypothetical protein
MTAYYKLSAEDTRAIVDLALNSLDEIKTILAWSVNAGQNKRGQYQQIDGAATRLEALAVDINEIIRNSEDWQDREDN